MTNQKQTSDGSERDAAIEPLDQLLHNWSDQIEPDEARLASLTEIVLRTRDIVASLDDTKMQQNMASLVPTRSRDTQSLGPVGDDALPRSASSQPTAIPSVNREQNCIPYTESSTPSERRCLNGMAVMACATACLLFVAVLVAMGTNRKESPNLARGSTIKSRNESTRVNHSADPLNRLDVETMVGLWRDNAALFGTEMDWLCDLENELLLHLRSQAPSAGVISQDEIDSYQKRPMVCIVLHVRDRSTGSHTWSNRWTCRLICPVAESIDFASARQATSGSVWVQPVENGRFVVSHWLNCEEAPELSGLVEQACLPGKPQVLSTRISNGRESQLVQQLVVIGRS